MKWGIQMAALGIDRLVIAIRAKDIGEIRQEVPQSGDDVIAATRDL